MKMDSLHLFSLCLLTALPTPTLQAFGEDRRPLINVSVKVSTPFSIALDNLQRQINYTFKNIGLLRRAMTHASYSEENNKALGLLGVNVIESSVALQLLSKNVDTSSKDLSDSIADASKVDGSCNADGVHLGLERIVRVSHKTNASAPSVICGAFRAMYGAIAVDSASSDEAGKIYLKVHSGIGNTAVM
ncbi:protein NUCLEAR FUSION DEFECTIVE 2 [Andrographis paniculata]|uniref:protein NUCLEAR FUSION DEFECTIVE 2 n=1 Tax=Andrographis paniculata TaxID=175694 RepID=UPI0021E841A9|nr:protein NUCLEAR FUSION DEFECTIVE 2 [Andrographis paniculata]